MRLAAAGIGLVCALLIAPHAQAQSTGQSELHESGHRRGTHHGHPPGSGPPSGASGIVAQGFACGSGSVTWHGALVCEPHQADLMVMQPDDVAGLTLSIKPPFKFVSGATFSYANFTTAGCRPFPLGILFEGTKNGEPASYLACSCDAAVGLGECDYNPGGKFTFSESTNPELSGLQVSQIKIILFGGYGPFLSIIGWFELNKIRIHPNIILTTSACPTLPSNSCASGN